MKKDFTQWKDDYGLEFEPNYSKETELDCRAAFQAGQQSKQDEVDLVKDQFDRVLKTANWHIEDCCCSHPMSKYQLGWFEAMSLIKEKLNGL